MTELAFSRRGFIAPHSNPDLTLFIVISGGGFVQVGDERIRVNHGEAVIWPPDVDHGAYTDGVEMRAIVVELPERAPAGNVIDVTAAPLVAGESRLDEPSPADGASPATPSRADGALAPRDSGRDEYDTAEGEPW